jgi:transcriptional regulator with XRE-family HTH domain
MAAKLTLGQILTDMRAAGWTPAQIQKRTGVSRQTQWAIRTGKTPGKSHATAIRQARRTGTKPPPKHIRPVPAARPKDIIWEIAAQIRETGVNDLSSHEEDSVQDLIDEVGLRQARTILKQQLQSTQRYMAGSIEPGHTRWFQREDKWQRIQRNGEELVFDDDYDKFFWYHGKK